MDTNLFLTLVIVLVSTIIVAVGVYLILVLRDVRANLDKLYKLLHHLESMAETVDKKVVGPTSNILGIASAVKEGLSMISVLKKRREESKEN